MHYQRPTFHRWYQQHENIIFKIIIIILAMIIAGMMCNIVGINHQTKQDINAAQQVINQRNQVIKQQNKQIKALQQTSAMRNFQTAKQKTDDALNGALGALYTWDGSSYANRYQQALKYMNKTVLKQLVAVNGSIPTKQEIKSTANAYQQNNATSRLTSCNNGIQNISDNKVTGFCLISYVFTEFGKNAGMNVQFQYTYDLSTQKLTNIQIISQ